MAPPLNNLTTRHYFAAIMRASGASWAEIGPAVGLTPDYLKALGTSPLFEAEINRIGEKFRSHVEQSAVNLLQTESLASVELLREFRDDLNTPRTLRLKAAESILDRVPRTSKTQRHMNTETTNFTPTDDQVKIMLDALNDDPIAAQAFQRALEREQVVELLEVS